MPRVPLPVALPSIAQEHNSQGRVAETHRQDFHMPVSVSVPADQGTGFSYLLLCACLYLLVRQARSSLCGVLSHTLLPGIDLFLPGTGQQSTFIYPSQSTTDEMTETSC